MNLSVINSLCYTVGWFWCVIWGIHGESALALVGALFLISFQLYCSRIKNIALYIQDIILVLFSVPLGTLLEVFFIQANLVHYVGTTKIFPPIWIICLYPLFSLLLNHSLKKIKTSYLLSFLFGFLGAPLSYAAGLSLGGLTFAYPLSLNLILIGIFWGGFQCLLSKIGNDVEKASTETLKECDSKNSLELLYDGECPICKREICTLQKKDQRAAIKFIDISSKDFSSFKHNEIDYNTAMSQIHAIDDKGNILIGIPAFAAIYARCQLLVISTFLRIPFLKGILESLYSLFAKNRLWITGRTNTNRNK